MFIKLGLSHFAFLKRFGDVWDLSGFPLLFVRESLTFGDSMRILVQDSATKFYFDGAEWTEHHDKAKTFESVAQAETFCNEQRLTGALIVVKFKDASRDISYPVGGRHSLMVSRPATTRIDRLY
jgi:hypothetical protein